MLRILQSVEKLRSTRAHEFAQRVEDLLELVACIAAERVVLHRQRPRALPNTDANRGAAGVLDVASEKGRSSSVTRELASTWGSRQTSRYLNTPSSNARMRPSSPW